ncbi:MAG: LytTR family DNA-binding domain-containing protein [Bacteroidales bacterium]|jgi:two-component system LytT family response regulator|nr:LytTR family DNA-binding domain-containing protein [Bacteroidales bacterium]
MSSQNLFNKLKAIIVDDELHGRENLKKILETYCTEVEVLGLADSVLQAKELVSIHHPDVVFLDINMPGLDGFDFLEQYDERNFMVVFVSAHEEFGINAVKASVADYVLKPVNIKELRQTVKKLLSLHIKAAKVETLHDIDKLVIPASHGFRILVVDDIIRLKADGCYTTIVINGGKDTLVSRTLKDFEDTLPKEKFFRIHKSHLINLKYIKDYSNFSGNFVTMTDGSRIEISRRKAPEFIQKIKTVVNTI